MTAEEFQTALKYFHQRDYKKAEAERAFENEIMAVHPALNKCTEADMGLYMDAINLVGDRHEKYALVNLTYWLLRRATRAEAELKRLNDTYEFDP
jgi:hypothetical protein